MNTDKLDRLLMLVVNLCVMIGITRLRIHYVSMMRIREYAWQQYNNGVLDEQTFVASAIPLAPVPR